MGARRAGFGLLGWIRAGTHTIKNGLQEELVLMQAYI